jgi:hypothetical protein
MELRNSELPMPVSKPLKNGELSLALKGDKMVTLQNPEPILQALRYVMVLVGVRAQNLPNDHEKTILVNYIKKNYGGHTPEEIKLAFEKAINGELDVDATCFENFSVLYFSKVMNAYREWAVQQIKHEEEVVLPIQLTDQQLDDIVRKDIEEFFQRCRKGNIQAVPPYFKEILVKDGLIPEKESVSGFFVKRLGSSKNIYINDPNPR